MKLLRQPPSSWIMDPGWYQLLLPSTWTPMWHFSIILFQFIYSFSFWIIVYATIHSKFKVWFFSKSRKGKKWPLSLLAVSWWFGARTRWAMDFLWVYLLVWVFQQIGFDILSYFSCLLVICLNFCMNELNKVEIFGVSGESWSQICGGIVLIFVEIWGGELRGKIWSLQKGFWLQYGTLSASFLTSLVCCFWAQSKVTVVLLLWLFSIFARFSHMLIDFLSIFF